jgi:hypothetical protein
MARSRSPAERFSAVASWLRRGGPVSDEPGAGPVAANRRMVRLVRGRGVIVSVPPRCPSVPGEGRRGRVQFEGREEGHARLSGDGLATSWPNDSPFTRRRPIVGCCMQG